jgi:hypothetical protein
MLNLQCPLPGAHKEGAIVSEPPVFNFAGAGDEARE